MAKLNPDEIKGMKAGIAMVFPYLLIKRSKGENIDAFLDDMKLETLDETEAFINTILKMYNIEF